MGEKYVVFVDEQEIAGTFALAPDVASFGIGATPSTRGDELGYRRSLLGTVASSLVGDAGKPDSIDPGAVGAAMGSFALGVGGLADDGGEEPEPPKGVKILEAVNAIILDEDVANFEALKQVHGISVFENVELSLPEPVDDDGAGVAAAVGTDWHLQQIGLESPSSGGDGILIGILDTGIDPAHPEFAGKTIHFQEFDWFGNQVAGPTRDADTHGTHVSSIAAGATAGVAPRADLAVAAVLTRRRPTGMTGSLAQIVTGFNWLVSSPFRAADVGVDIINASLGGAGYNDYLRSSVQSAFQLGIPLIAAIGNSGRKGVGHHGSPGNYPEAISVGAADQNDIIANFSDWGVGPPPSAPKYPTPMLCAPGVQVVAAVPGGGFQAKSGTSMATPVVAGVAARRMSANPALVGAPGALRIALLSMLAPCTPNPLGNRGGAGRIIA